MFDSIYRMFTRPWSYEDHELRLLLGWLIAMLAVDVPMAKVKFNVNTEYAYIQNFKVLQSTPSWAIARHMRYRPVEQRNNAL